MADSRPQDNPGGNIGGVNHVDENARFRNDARLFETDDQHRAAITVAAADLDKMLRDGLVHDQAIVTRIQAALNALKAQEAFRLAQPVAPVVPVPPGTPHPAPAVPNPGRPLTDAERRGDQPAGSPQSSRIVLPGTPPPPEPPRQPVPPAPSHQTTDEQNRQREAEQKNPRTKKLDSRFSGDR